MWRMAEQPDIAATVAARSASCVKEKELSPEQSEIPTAALGRGRGSARDGVAARRGHVKGESPARADDSGRSQVVSIGEVQVRTYIIGALLAGLLSISQADSVKTKDGHSYQGTVQYSDADTIKVKLVDSDEVKVFDVGDVAEVKVDSSAAQPAPPEKSPPPYQQTAKYWERQGYADGSRKTGLKATLAGAGGCIGVPIGGYVGYAVGSAADPYGATSTGAGCLVGAAAGGVGGCLGGSALGSLGQREAVGPTLDSVGQDAYRRGFQRGVRHSNTVAIGVGAGAAVLSAAGFLCLLLAYMSLMIDS
jgi:hypothetical protein